MNAILHCGRCGSWAEFKTDGDGSVVEKLNHECRCPPRLEVPALRGRPVVARVCADCPAIITHQNARRCPRCACERDRQHNVATAKRRSVRLNHPPPKCIGCGCELDHPLAKRCTPCRIKNDAAVERERSRRLRRVA